MKSAEISRQSCNTARESHRIARQSFYIARDGVFSTFWDVGLGSIVNVAKKTLFGGFTK